MNDISVITNIVLAIMSFILAAISVVTVVITLRQNSKMLENASRPYVSVFLGTTYFSSLTTYLVIKNYGSSSAKITEFSSDIDFKKIAFDTKMIPFGNISGATLCPGESIQYPVNLINLTDSIHSLNISIKYESGKHKYEENKTVNLLAHYDVVHLRSNTKDEHLKEISFALQDIAEKML